VAREDTILPNKGDEGRLKGDSGGAVGGLRDRKLPVHFGVWHPISEASAVAPEASGVLQTRAEGVMDYRSGRSAMVLYACTEAGETLRGFVSGRGARDLERSVSAGARWIRFAQTATPRVELDRLLEGFVSRFGSPPINNAGAGRRTAAAKTEEGPA
jgi:hypothetical protein